jgi:Replication initiator protein, pSAM2
MTEPVQVGELLPNVIAEAIARAGPGYERWAEQVAATGYCAHPVRLRGTVDQIEVATQQRRTLYATDREPDATLLKACGNRRASVCRSCSATYQADSYQLLAAGLKGGKGVPDTVAGHPRLFVTFTAPSFGQVHTRKAQGRLVLPCRPYRQAQRCPHGRPAGCWHRHDPDDPRLGEPLCPGCYDGGGQVIWNALAPELWRRTTIGIHRALARRTGLTQAQLSGLVRVSYAKVAEFQRRGAIHFHAILRLDAATDCRCPACLLPPPPPFTARLLEEAVGDAMAGVTVPCPTLQDRPGARHVRWGAQLDVRNITQGDGHERELSAEQVAGYVAKYATKATESFGLALDRRLTADDLDELAVPAHVAELVRACWDLGAQPGLVRLRLRAWAHMLGFGGHFSTKSRRYSTTLGALRRARATYARRRRGNTLPLDVGAIADDDDQAVMIVASWSYLGSGYQTTGEAWLAASAAARAREARRIAREELRTTIRAV